MDHIVNSTNIESTALRGLLAYIGELPKVCLKVVDRSGKIISVSSAGLQLLQSEMDELIGRTWTDFWTGQFHSSAVEAVERAFNGEVGKFNGCYDLTAEPTNWRVEALPLERNGDVIETIVVISTQLDSEVASSDLPSLENEMRELLHKMRNVASVSQGAGRLLQKGLREEMVAEMARSLVETGKEAAVALSNFEEHIGIADQNHVKQN